MQKAKTFASTRKNVTFEVSDILHRVAFGSSTYPHLGIGDAPGKKRLGQEDKFGGATARLRHVTGRAREAAEAGARMTTLLC